MELLLFPLFPHVPYSSLNHDCHLEEQWLSFTPGLSGTFPSNYTLTLYHVN